MRSDDRGAGRVRWPVRTSVAVAAVLAGAAVLGHRAALAKTFEATLVKAENRFRRRPAPDVVWETADPEVEGLSRAALDSLRTRLAAQGTEAFLVIRGNHVVCEWYRSWRGANLRQGLGAMAKATTANVALLAAATDGWIAFDDPARKYVPGWRGDPLRSRIRLADLAAHQSGLATEDFGAPQGGWRQPYLEHPEQRFAIALSRVPVVFPPGTRYNYAGAGYYVLAYALTAGLKKAPQHDIRTFLQDRVMRPIGIPDADWQLSYGESYEMDGMTLYAMGSGAEYTARAAARMGQLILDFGRWGDRRLLDSALVAWSLQPATAQLPPDSGDYRRPPSTKGGGWAANSRASWPEVPRDAVAAMGSGHEIILVVPSLDLVMVRLGRALSPDAEFGPTTRDHLFAPLMRAVIGPSSRMPKPAQRTAALRPTLPLGG